MARECQKNGGKIAVEWPKGCQYWRMNQVNEFINELKLAKVNIDGCALGLKVDKGVPMLKPWTIATDDNYLFMHFKNKKCPGKDDHPEHCPVAGKYTKLTENYTDQMVRIFIKAGS